MMPSWFGRLSSSGGNDSHSDTQVYGTVVSGLQELYRLHLRELEKDYRHNHLYSPLLTDGDFSAKPMVMVMGQYSTGKTTFIRHLLERDYPGLRIGPEPTTDKFVGVMTGDGKTEQQMPGNAAVVNNNLPWSQLVEFGNFFLSRFECSFMEAPILQGITLVDTPGVLSGNKQADRGYDFDGVVKWFAERVDLILLMFDAHKLDISDEFRRCINALSGNDSKIRILLNKADCISSQQLLRIYGALMWSLGKVIPSPEVARVYIGSFWDKPLQSEENRKLFEAEANDLYADISLLPRNAAVRKLNDFIKRARHVKAHSLLMNHLRKNMPFFAKAAKQKQMIGNLEQIMQSVSREQGVPLGDFPSVEVLQRKLHDIDFSKFPRLDKSKIENIDKMLQFSIARLMQLLPREEEQASKIRLEGTMVGVNRSSPFTATVAHLPAWAESKFLRNPPDTARYIDDFAEIAGSSIIMSGQQAREDLLRSQLPSSVLHRIWNLADATKDGALDLYEYSLARHFIQMKQEGFELPAVLPEELVPPSMKRRAPQMQSPLAVGLMSNDMDIREFAGAGVPRYPIDVSDVADLPTSTSLEGFRVSSPLSSHDHTGNNVVVREMRPTVGWSGGGGARPFHPSNSTPSTHHPSTSIMFDSADEL